MDRTAVLQELDPISHVTTRQIEHNPQTRVLVSPGEVVIRPGAGGHLIPLGEQGIKAMSKFVGIPEKLGDSLSPDTFGRVATDLLARKERYNLLLANGEVLQFSEFRGVRNLPVDRVLANIERVIPNCDYYRVCKMENYSATLEIVGTKEEAVHRGDLVRAGAMVQFSPVNTVKPLVQSYVMRLACTNGATSKTVLAEFTGGNGDGDFWEWFRHSVRGAYAALNDVVGRYRQMMQERIPAEQRAGALEQLLREAGITGKDAEAVRAQAIQDPPHNSYDMMNLITWASSHIIERPERVRRALNAGAAFASESDHASVCPLCHARRQTSQLARHEPAEAA